MGTRPQSGNHFRRMEVISVKWKSFPQNGNHFRKMEIISVKWKSFPQNGNQFCQEIF
jgi:hypothetical protein